MSLKINFEQLSILYEENVKAVENSQEYFSSNKYSEEKRLAKLVFDKVKSKCEIFLAMVKGPIGSSGIDNPEIERVICFPMRFLNQPSTATMPDALQVTIEEAIEETFFLGLRCHLGLTTSPTRSDVGRVNMDTLFNIWILDAVVADTKMKIYNKECCGAPARFFEFFYNSKIEPALKEQFKLGFWKRSKCFSFFRNLFFAGACLGMHCDLVTKGEPYIAQDSKFKRGAVMEPINLDELRAGMRGRPYNTLIREHLKHQKARQFNMAIEGTKELLPPGIRDGLEDFCDHYNSMAYEADFWRQDCAEVFDLIIEGARDIMQKAGITQDDETLFNIFQLVTMNFALAVSVQPGLRTVAGIETR